MLNSKSLEALKGCRVEPSLAGAPPGSRFQFERRGYFCVDSRDSAAGRLVFNRTLGVRDTWAKIEKGGASSKKGSLSGEPSDSLKRYYEPKRGIMIVAPPMVEGVETTVKEKRHLSYCTQ